MASITFAIDSELRSNMSKFRWVNWSEVNREELNKKRIFEEFLKTGTVSTEDQKFCDEINWDPIDELEVREEYVNKIKGIVKGTHSKPMTLEEFNKWCDSL